MSEIRVPAWSGTGGSPLLVFRLIASSRGGEQGRESSSPAALIRALIPFRGLHPHDII